MQERKQAKCAQDLIRLFNNCFKCSENTILVGNASEPLYLPVNEHSQYNQVVFSHDYFSSALHEIAHWCIAGKERRKQIDYAYWYLPDGRNAQQQSEFERVEVKPQALELAFSKAAGTQFRVSIDNLQGEETCSKVFEMAVEKQFQKYVACGFQSRAQRFLDALHDFYGTPALKNREMVSYPKQYSSGV